MSTTLHPAATATFSSLAAELSAVLTDAAIAPLADRAFLRIAGLDATRWLNGMVTNSIQALAPGEGCYNFLLNAQGRILGDCTIYRDPAPEPPVFLLESDTSQIETIQNHLDRFIIMDDVELTPLTGERAGLLLFGPQAALLLDRLGLITDPTSPQLRIQSVEFQSAAVDLITAHSPITPIFELWANAATIDTLATALAAVGATAITPATFEALRILSGTPRYGVDIRNTDATHDLPQETAQDRALHFAKGCYLGQEIVERIRSRGSVHRTFTGFVLTGALPSTGTELTSESAPRPVGELTSIAAIPNPARPEGPPLQIALGYIRRETLDRKLPLSYPGGMATPAPLPFAVPDAQP